MMFVNVFTIIPLNNRVDTLLVSRKKSVDTYFFRIKVIIYFLGHFFPFQKIMKSPACWFFIIKKHKKPFIK